MLQFIYWLLGYKDIDPEVEFEMLYPHLKIIKKYYSNLLTL